MIYRCWWYNHIHYGTSYQHRCSRCRVPRCVLGSWWSSWARPGSQLIFRWSRISWVMLSLIGWICMDLYGFSQHILRHSLSMFELIIISRRAMLCQGGQRKVHSVARHPGRNLPHWHCCRAWQVWRPRAIRALAGAGRALMSRDGKLWECFQFKLPQLGDLYGLLWIYEYLWWFGGDDMTVMKEWRWVDCRFQFNYRPLMALRSWDAQSQGSPTALNNLGFATSPWGKTSYLVKLWTWNLG